MIVQACIFEIVTTQVDQVPVPAWAFEALGMPVESRNFRYAEMLYPDGRRKDHWRTGNSVPDVSRPETKLWFYFLAASYIDLGVEAIHFGQTELMNGNDRDLAHYAQVLGLIRAYATKHARRHMLICDSHVPSGGLVRDGRLLMDFHSFPLRIKEVPDKPQNAILEVGFSDGIYGRSKGGMTPSGWKCDHLPYLVEIDNWGASRARGRRNRVESGSGATTRSPGSRIRTSSIGATGCLCLGLGPQDGPGGPSPDARQPDDAVAAGWQALVLRQHPEPGGPERAWRRGGDPSHLGGRRGEVRLSEHGWFVPVPNVRCLHRDHCKMRSRAVLSVMFSLVLTVAAQSRSWAQADTPPSHSASVSELLGYEPTGLSGSSGGSEPLLH